MKKRRKSRKESEAAVEGGRGKGRGGSLSLSYAIGGPALSTWVNVSLCALGQTFNFKINNLCWSNFQRSVNTRHGTLPKDNLPEFQVA